MRIGAILEALNRETRALGDLLHCAQVQQRAMVRGKVQLLERLGQRMSRGITAATEAREAREAAVREEAVRRGLGPGVSPATMLEAVPPHARPALEAAFQGVHRVAAELRRQNFQNHQLATVSADLVHEQLALLVGDTGGRDDRYPGRAPDAVSTPLSGLVNGTA